MPIEITPTKTAAAPSKLAFNVIKAGILSLVQDLGRFGQAKLGLTTGGPADDHAHCWANQLLGNDLNDSTIEITMGGFKAVALAQCQICVTGAKTKVTINNKSIPQWRVHNLRIGDVLAISFATEGSRIYFAIAGGFAVPKQLNSSATVIREGIGGLNGKGLQNGQILRFYATDKRPLLGLNKQDIPQYPKHLTLKVVTGYQYHAFETMERKRFFHSRYTVTQLADRMGYRLSGAAISFPTRNMFSEGIAQGAVQIPADGQPIVLGKDRQTIGGYPKIGSVLSTDLSKLMQTTAGATIEFEPISIETAHKLLHLAKTKFKHTHLAHYSSWFPS